MEQGLSTTFLASYRGASPRHLTGTIWRHTLVLCGMIAYIKPST